MRVLGAYPKNQTLKEKLTTIFNLIVVTTYIIEEIVYITTSPDSLADTVSTYAAFSMHALSVIRIVHGFVKMDTYLNLIATVKRKSFNFKGCGLQELYFSDSENSKIENKIQNITEKKLKKANFLSYLIVIGSMTGCWLSLIFSFWMSFLKPTTRVKEGNNTVILLEYPYKMYSFWDTTNSLIGYKIQFLQSCYVVSFVCSTFLVIDGFFHGCVLYISAQIEVIDEVLRNIKVPKDMKTNEKSEDQVLKIFRKCCAETQICLEMNDKLGNLLEDVFLIHYILGNYITCSLIYILPAFWGDEQKFWGIVFFGVMGTLHPLICCLDSQKLMDNVS